MPVWFRDETGKLTWVNKSYMDHVGAVNLDDIKSRQIELLEQRQRKAVAETIENNQSFSERFHTIM